MHKVELTADGRKALVKSQRTIHVYDSDTGKELHRLTGIGDSDFAVAPDGKTAVTCGENGTILFWDLVSGKEIKRLEGARFEGTNHTPVKLAISPDGRMLAMVESLATRAPILIWDTQSGKKVREIVLPAKPELYAICSIGFTHDGRCVYFGSGTDLHIPVFEVVTGKLLYTMQRTNGGVHSAAMSLDGRLMVAGTGDSLYLWEIATGQKRLVVKDSSYLTDVALSPNGRVLAVINNGRVSTVSGEGRTEHTQDRKAIRLLDAFSGKELHKFQGHMGSVNSIAWTLDGKRLLSGCADSTSLIWEVPSWIYLPPKNQPVKLPKPDELWEQLGSSDCEKAWQAIGNLVQLPDTARALIGEKIKPVAAPDAKRVQKWIADLDSEEFSEREKATRELRLLGDAAEPFLRSALAGTPSEEARTRLDGILSRSSGNRIVTGRCLEVLERIGDDPSLKLLTEYAHGAKKCWLTNEAEAAIKRLDQR